MGLRFADAYADDDVDADAEADANAVMGGGHGRRKIKKQYKVLKLYRRRPQTKIIMYRMPGSVMPYNPT